MTCLAFYTGSGSRMNLLFDVLFYVMFFENNIYLDTECFVTVFCVIYIYACCIIYLALFHIN